MINHAEMQKIMDELQDEQIRYKRLEAFMVAVAKEVKCLPSFADPSPEGGNAHIIRAIRNLTTQSSIHERRNIKALEKTVESIGKEPAGGSAE